MTLFEDDEIYFQLSPYTSVSSFLAFDFVAVQRVVSMGEMLDLMNA
jgi:hypothetical protein